MAEAQAAEEDAVPRKSAKLPFLVGLVLMAAAGGGGFLAARAGLIPLPGGHGADTHDAAGTAADPLPDIAFVALEPMIVSLAGRDSGRHLRFTAQLEVNEQYQSEVQHLVPRVLDVLNSYLRAVDAKDLEDPSGLVRLRAQMVRRVRLVTGEGRVRDVLLTEFVIN